ncbi:hypothetical protein [uncultured Megasphaera sp.]|uniref:hypothetical protein n=1 Tax=uncultured Megasphaera sp. TaxID=165188 RepID=UPI00263412AE|nr:hypothetical protein [uncultured Megasphaera sp.]
MTVLEIMTALYIVAAMALTFLISRHYGTTQAAVELSIILLLPGLGFLISWLLHVNISLFRLGQGEIETVPVEAGLFSLQDRGYNTEIIPMNDIFLLEDSQLKRKYFTDAIRQGMVTNQDILRAAVHDEDREIAYFAVSLMTAKMEALSDELFQLEQQLRRTPENPDLLKTYVEKLKQFLDSGYGEEMTKHQQQQSYIAALELLNQQLPDQSAYYVERIDMLILCGRLADAQKACREFAEKHAGIEEPLLMEIKLYQALKDAGKLQETVQALKALPRRLSPEALRVIRFWDKEAIHA